LIQGSHHPAHIPESLRQLRDVPLAPIQPLRDRRGMGRYAWCMGGIKSRHWRYTEWGDLQGHPVCPECALIVMQRAGLGRRFPYKTEIKPELGGVANGRPRRIMAGYRIKPGPRPARTKRKSLRDKRRQAVAQALMTGPKTRRQLLALTYPDGSPVFKTLNALSTFLSKHMREDLTGLRLRGRGANKIELTTLAKVKWGNKFKPPLDIP